MDAKGAQALAERIAAAVRIGSTVELAADGPGGLIRGERGVVLGIEAGGVRLRLERGRDELVDPRSTPLRPLGR
jgi:hypothetical protein